MISNRLLMATLGLSAWALMVWPTTHAQTELRQPRFAHITQEHGLSSDTVLAIVEDPRGFMWFGTDDGLSRFDGHEFVVYRSIDDDPQSLSHGRIQAMLVDRQGRLWLGTSNGLDRYDPEADAFVRYDIAAPGSTGRNSRVVHSLHEDRVGNIWAGLEKGLARLDPESGIAEHFYRQGLPRIIAVIEDRSGKLWIGGDGSGLDIFDPDTETFTPHDRGHEATGDGLSEEIYSLLEDSDGFLWIGSHAGLDRYDPRTGTFTRLRHDPDDPTSLSSDHVDALFEDRHGRLWVGTDGGGIEIIGRHTLTITHVPHRPYDSSALPTNVIRKIFEDSKGDIWVGTFRGGLAFFDSRTAAFRHVSKQPSAEVGLADDQVLSFFEEDDGRLWVGTEKGLSLFDASGRGLGIWRHDPTNPNSLSANAVLCVLRDSRGDLWAGTYFGGLNRLRGDPNTALDFVHYRPDADTPGSLSNPHVWDMVEDADGQLWLATLGGLNRYVAETDSFVNYRNDPQDPQSLAYDQVWQVYVDSQNTLWAATTSGLSAYDRQTDGFRNYARDVNVVMVLEGSGKGANRPLWLGTEGWGLLRVDRESGDVTVFDVDDGLANDVVLGILEDDRGQLWLSTQGSLSRFDPDTHEFTNFGTADGVLSIPFSRGAHLEAHDGEMLMGGVRGFIRFDPSEVRGNTFVPPVVLTDFRILDEEVAIGGPSAILDRHISLAQDISLRHDHSVIRFSFAALNFRSSENNRYAYRLDPFDQGWRDADDRRTATYTNLDPGEYVFRVKGSNNSGVWNEEGTAIRLTVSPPYWQTWRFRTAIVLGILGTLFGVHRYKIGSIRKLLAQVAENNTVLREQKAEIERFAYTISHELRTPLVTILNFLGAAKRKATKGETEQMHGDLRRIHGAAESMHQRLHKLSELLELYRDDAPLQDSLLACSLDDLVQRSFARLAPVIDQSPAEIRVQQDLPMVYADPQRLGEVFDILLDNALKFTQETSAPSIEIGATEIDADHGLGQVRCWVRDNGLGIDPRYHERIFALFERLDGGDEGVGLGLPMARKIVEKLGGRLWVESAGAGHGSIFYLTLPAGRVRR